MDLLLFGMRLSISFLEVNTIRKKVNPNWGNAEYFILNKGSLN